jgi:hypothetical protein
MDGREVAHRIWTAAIASAERIGLGRSRPRRPAEEFGKPWVWPIPTQFDVDLYRQAGDAVLQGRYRLFGRLEHQLGFPPTWNRDPKTGTVAPVSFGKALDYRDREVVGDIKYLWEPNRHLEIVTLAQAWYLSRDGRYAQGCRTLLDSWLDQCPYPNGPNWSSSLELALRLVNWSFAWHLLGGDVSPLFQGEDGERFKRRWLDAIYRHCHFISRYPSLHSSANNHLLGELLGLFVASITWPSWRESANWQSDAYVRFEQQALLQNAPDGVNREQAIWYQHEVADMMLIAGLVGRANGREFGSTYWRRLETMLEFIASIMDVGGNVPAFGDADDAMIARLCPSRDFDVYRSLLATGSVLFERPDFKIKAEHIDDKSRWLLGDQATMQFAAIDSGPAKLPIRRSFPDGGYFILGSDLETSREVRVVADAGPLGYLSIAAHGHADALSFTLSAAGRELLIDPGTYVYLADQRWREYFRSTAAHNTLVLNGQSQSVSGGSFIWTRHASAICEKADLSGSVQSLSMVHDGYLRLDGQPTHRRTLSYNSMTRSLLVQDEVACGIAHSIDICWHFAESCVVTLLDEHICVENDGVVMRMWWPQGSWVSRARGQEEPPLGWRSLAFDTRQSCETVIFHPPSRRDWVGVTRIEIALPSVS